MEWQLKPQAPKRGRGFFGKLRWAVISLLVLAVIGIGVWKYAFGPVSEGYRDGYVYKISQRGRLNKTYEGELALPGYSREAKPGQSGGSVWAFTLDDEKMAEEMQKVTGETLVRVYYREYSWHLPWQGDTNYRVYKFERVDPSKKD